MMRFFSKAERREGEAVDVRGGRFDLSETLSPAVFLYAVVGCIIGTLVGVLPGVGPLAGISLLLPASFGMDATSAIVLLPGIYYGAMYGGSTTSILMRIPGEAASVM